MAEHKPFTKFTKLLNHEENDRDDLSHQERCTIVARTIGRHREVSRNQLNFGENWVSSEDFRCRQCGNFINPEGDRCDECAFPITIKELEDYGY